MLSDPPHKAYRAVSMKRLAAALFAAAWLAGTAPDAFAQDRADTSRAQPEAATGWQDKEPVVAKEHMAVVAHPLAAHIARETLRKGGSAIDAAIAAQLVLNLVEPQSSGLGGGGFIVHWDAKAKNLTTYDGRETAPKAAKPDRFILNGRRMGYYAAVKSARSVGVPGLARLLQAVHAKHGKLTWAELFDPAIKLAEEGFPVGKRLHRLLRASRRNAFSPPARDYFFNAAGEPWPVGHMLKSPAFAQTLRTLAERGADAFYSGPIADAVVRTVNSGPESLHDMTLADLADYRVKERPPVCATYRTYRICGMGPPSSGPLTIAKTLKLLEPFDLGTEPLNGRALHLIAEAQKLAYADRAKYMADTDFVPLPKGLLDETYTAKRRALIDPAQAMRRANPGEPPGVRQGHYGTDTSQESSGTTHLSIVDRDGNAVSMTTTIEAAFGSGLMAAGLLLNNELTDFSFAAVDKDGRPTANRVEGGKRSRSSMSPIIVFDKTGNVRLVAGSPGGNRIMLYVIKALIAQLDWGLDAQDAASLPNFGSRNGPFEIEQGPWSTTHANAMRARGHEIGVSPMTSGLHLIELKDGRLHGGADPRREGVALGD